MEAHPYSKILNNKKAQVGPSSLELNKWLRRSSPAGTSTPDTDRLFSCGAACAKHNVKNIKIFLPYFINFKRGEENLCP